ncbi:hypothetical protein MACJ_000637 [Theileria orientalis]|uniref:Uncharacterized protein n=1 Tax=Theileria orientalis TaxID=68886 RepID=A0A976QRI2_THEOR|nr:hypothetical protein MACJ_000637 [Theileria orientalis]
MARNLGWEYVKRRSSIKIFSTVFKYHFILMFLVTVLNVMLFNVFRFLITSARSPIVNSLNVFINVAPSFLFIILLFCLKHISFKGCFVNSFYLDIFSFSSIILIILSALFTANSFIKLKVTEFRLCFVLIGCLLHFLRVRRQNLDVCRVLDRQNVVSLRLRSYLVKNLFHCILSYLLTLSLFGVMQLVHLAGQSTFPSLDTLKYNNLLTSFVYDVNYFLSQLPCTTDYYHFSFSFLEKFELFLALLWTLALCDYYLDMMNVESTHMDVDLMKSLDAMPVHNQSSLQDEILFARAAYNYSKNISYKLNNVTMKYVSNPPSLKMPEEEMMRSRRSYIQPFRNLTSAPGFKNSINLTAYDVDSKKDRYQLDLVVYKMLVDNSLNFWSNYVNSCLETMEESRLNLHHLVDYPFTKDQKINILDENVQTYKDARSRGFYTSFQSFLIHVASYFNCFHRSKTLSTNLVNMLLLCIVYLRGITSWLCIANMIGTDHNKVKFVAKDVILHSLKIHKTISTLNTASIPTHIRSYLETLNTDINSTLKKLAVFTETLLYSKFDTSFETFRQLEHLFNNRRLST